MNVIPKKTIKFTDFYIYTQNPPWTDLAKRSNDPRIASRRPKLIEPLKTWDFFRGDLVRVFCFDIDKRILLSLYFPILSESRWK